MSEPHPLGGASRLLQGSVISSTGFLGEAADTCPECCSSVSGRTRRLPRPFAGPLRGLLVALAFQSVSRWRCAPHSSSSWTLGLPTGSNTAPSAGVIPEYFCRPSVQWAPIPRRAPGADLPQHGPPRSLCHLSLPPSIGGVSRL